MTAPHSACRWPRAQGPVRHSAVRALCFFAWLVRGVLAAAAVAGLLGGLPWALIHFVGWPLPDHLPSWGEIEGALLGAMTTTFLLDFLACLTWLVWAFFALDVARCAIGIASGARMPDLSTASPLRRIAAMLVGAVLLSILGQRTALASATVTAAGAGGSEVLATAPAWNKEFGRTTTWVRPVGFNGSLHVAVPADAGEQPVRAKSATVLPYDPAIGVYDSLWRMAERKLGDGNRWPEIYELNKGKPQPDGGTFTHPGRIFPGEEMMLPVDATEPPAPPPPATPPPETSTSPPNSSTMPTPPSTQAPDTTQVPPTTQHPRTAQKQPSMDARGEPAFSWGEELFVGLGLASAASAALVVARRRSRRSYRSGSGDRSDLPVAPVVYQLRLAYLRAGQDDLDADSESNLDQLSEHLRREPRQPIVVSGGDSTADSEAPVLPIGVRDGREIALDLAGAHGLGLLGPSATAAARALLVAALTTTAANAGGTPRVIVPAKDLVVLLGRRIAQASLPAILRVTPDLDAALDMLESETLVRVGHPTSAGQAWPPLVLVARAPGRQSRRLQAVLDNGSIVGVTGLLLGQWAPGVSAYVRDDGTISATSPGFGEPLRGTRVFRLGDGHVADLLDLLHRAQPVDESDPQSIAEPLREAGEQTDVIDPAGDGHLELLAADKDAALQGDRDLELVGSASAIRPNPRLRPHGSAHTGTGTDKAPPSTTTREHPVDDKLRSPIDKYLHIPLVPLRMSVLGPTRVWWGSRPAVDGEVVEREVTSAFQPRLRELLVFLALHPDGASREALIAALWATSPPEKTTNAVNTSLSRLRRAVAAATEGTLSDVVLAGEGRYRLAPELVEVDYWSFAAAVAARRAAATAQDRVEAYRRIVDSYTGSLADGLSTEWIETAREAIRRDAIDAVAALARALVDDDPQQTLDLLEIARAFDPHNELIYRDIMRLQERLGQLDAIPRTLTLLTTRLAEIDDRPTSQAIDLAERLRRRHDAPGEPVQADRGRSRAG
jgi:DNA-binding SARP family transcriptional activator